MLNEIAHIAGIQQHNISLIHPPFPTAPYHPASYSSSTFEFDLYIPHPGDLKNCITASLSQGRASALFVTGAQVSTVSGFTAAASRNFWRRRSRRRRFWCSQLLWRFSVSWRPFFPWVHIAGEAMSQQKYPQLFLGFIYIYIPPVT